jgi:thiamine biosynthesis lipoprotein ApbE
MPTISPVGAEVTTNAATWSALGCVVRVVVTDPDALPAAVELLEEGLRAIDHACSRFRADSELIQAQAKVNGPIPVSPLFGAALDAALRAARLTDGLVSPTVADSIVAFGYDRDFSDLPEDGPSPIEPEPPMFTWRAVCLSADRTTVSLPAGTRLDLGATAKALAADRAAARIAAVCGCGVLVSLGGDITVAGKAPPEGWSVRVQDSPGPIDDAPIGSSCVIALVDGALATSSVQHRRWRRGGRSYHHIIDPRTGRPARSPWRTVSVTAASCVDANIASTAAVVMGEPAVSWLTVRGLPARLVGTDGGILRVNGWPEDDR